MHHDKKTQIIEAAIVCFARKGFHATSIQEIVDELGMAKGSIYFYFKSKDDLLLSVFQHYGEMLLGLTRERPEDLGLSPRDRLARGIERQFRFLTEHLDFMRMLLKEPPTGLHPEIQQMLLKLRVRGILWNVSHLKAIYGSSVDRFLGDAATLLSGLTSHYFEIVLFEETQLDATRLGRFLVKRLDDLVEGMQRSGEAPIVPNPDLEQLRAVAGLESDNRELEELLLGLRSRFADNADRQDERTRGDLQAAIGLLQAELAKGQPGGTLLARGMLALLHRHADEAGQEIVGRLERLVLGEAVE